MTLTQRVASRRARHPRQSWPKAQPGPKAAPPIPCPDRWNLNVSRVPKKSMQILRGIAVSPGLAIGPALVFDPRGLRLPVRTIDDDAVAAELVRLDAGLDAARTTAEADEADARGRLGPQYADILGAHARMIADPVLRQGARQRIELEKITAEHAVTEELDGYAERLRNLADPHLAARAADVRDIQTRIIAWFSGRQPSKALIDPPEACIALVHDLSPSQTAGLNPKRVLGFATEAGGRTSHTAIVAAALEIPAVVGIGSFLARARDCRRVIIDGDEGLVILDPDAETLHSYHQAETERATRFAALAGLASLPAVTADGIPITLLGNIEFPVEVAACRDRGAQGIGLYRTEFLYLNADRPPDEAEQFVAYEAVVQSMAGHPVTIRTLDLGVDKLTTCHQGDNVPTARNPVLSLRSLRLSLREPSLFRTQLRAILRVSALGDVRVMFPLVSTLSEFRQARAILDDVARELTAEGIPVPPNLPVGAMIEVPAAAVMAGSLAKEVDFFSIGTNDLIQYTLAVDRGDESVANLYNASDPAILRLIAMVVEGARPLNRDVTICGSMGGDPLYTMLLLGLGVHGLSMPPHQLPEVKRIIRAVTLDQARTLARDALQQETGEAVTTLLQSAMDRALNAATTPNADRATRPLSQSASACQTQ
ncbi:MAG: phosphoenolpyruvate--protein phosphotransferase [Isosphaeraceae bacterium]